jgi:hypothetical protein
MKAFLTSIGENTTQICKEQLERFGFEVILLDKVESWEDKYKSFIKMANEDCIRIDADTIPNGNIKRLADINYGYMVQALGYDFYRNDVGIIGAVYYNKKALDIIRNKFDEIDWRRPEATAWRLPEINKYVRTMDLVIGMHGFFQDYEHLLRHKEHKISRKQIEDYDFNLAKKMLELCQKD